jgi:hypothetical protein
MFYCPRAADPRQTWRQAWRRRLHVTDVLPMAVEPARTTPHLEGLSRTSPPNFWVPFSGARLVPSRIFMAVLLASMFFRYGLLGTVMMMYV